ncbi:MULTISPECIES: hypothetical protein [Pseudomonas]|jgi:hypothetical protein|uniref:Uncharacterized protein n=3 Tax=Pseudomonas TaxID=286 RepID=A0AA34WRS8_PSEPU|nr:MULTISPECIES: hypothetical protein [Pseudomonas]HBK49909.1 hypothetical protein [Pseudomonas sp.]ADR62040.1 Hypothetical protein PPUBIRD1_4469 [Pseudomonas putida BIRD-1]AJA14257.1 hypothetical protein RPPX_13165 [Pseudomonas putida S12]AVD93707.1 hypothetical protein C4Q27_15415 [Pseudomonas sp. SWI36]MBI6886058.1 hypothetical protein [Pseudomonas putida]
MTEYSNWKEITATPEAHLEFLRVIDGKLEEGLGGRNLYEKLSKEITVEGKAFSQAFHLNKLEASSNGWDTDETPDPVKLEIVELTSRIKEADPGYDLAHFMVGYEYMISEMKERGVEVNAGLDHSDPVPKNRSGSDYEPGM